MKDDRIAAILSLLMLGLLLVAAAGCSTICGVNLGVPLPGCPTPVPTPETHADVTIDYDVAVEANR